jgi:hypothetical protein
VPKYDFFGVGWEAFGALGWKTSANTAEQDVDKYLSLGIPLRWMVVGSGFWDGTHERLLSTTSFGKWNRQICPDPGEFIDRFRRQGLKFVIGLRIAFIHDGPFAEEGLRRGYFIKEHGAAKLYHLAFPRRPVYLLDTNNEEAVSWYVELCGRWGVDGFKEDLFGFEPYVLPDDKLDRVNERLMKKGYLVMGRNAYLTSPSDLHRFEDFNYHQDQDRGPINSLTLAYSGFPFVYPDTHGLPRYTPACRSAKDLGISAIQRSWKRCETLRDCMTGSIRISSARWSARATTGFLGRLCHCL